MDAITLNEIPSTARRRLSTTLPSDAEEVPIGAKSSPSSRRRSSQLRLDGAYGAAADRRRSSVSVLSARGEGGGRGDAVPGGRASISGRRASSFSRFFALSSTSESFLEEDVKPSIINAMLFFDDPDPDVEKIRAVLSKRLLEIPRFRSRCRQEEDGSVHWEPIPRNEVDLEHHVTVTDGGDDFDDDDIQDLLFRAYESIWSIDKPLWRMNLIKNLGDGRSLLFCSIDHAIGDGVAMLAVMLSLLDDPADGTKKTKSFQKQRKQGPTLRWSHRLLCFLDGVFRGVKETFVPPSDSVNSLKIPPDLLNKRCPGKTFVQTKALSLPNIKAMKDKLPGVTVNDLVLALLTIGLRRFFEETGDPVMESVRWGGKILGEFPVNMRPQASGGEEAVTNFGNDVVIASFAFPMTYRDPVDAVWKCKAQVDEMKNSPLFFIKKKLVDKLLGVIPDSILASTVTEGFNRNTCLMSNVMGPQAQATMAGYVLDDLDFTVTFPGALYFGVLSYNSKLRISAILDQRAEADGSKLKQCLEAAFTELVAAIDEAGKEGRLFVPDPTPMSARVLEFLIYAVVVALPIVLALQSK